RPSRLREGARLVASQPALIPHARCALSAPQSSWRFVSEASRQPPRATRFPYTTLFRSHGKTPAFDIGKQERAVRRHFYLRMKPGDRKSTRLNSSHGSISYAVFCLKKKTKSQAATSPAENARVRNRRGRAGVCPPLAVGL